MKKSYLLATFLALLATHPRAITERDFFASLVKRPFQQIEESQIRRNPHDTERDHILFTEDNPVYLEDIRPLLPTLSDKLNSQHLGNFLRTVSQIPQEQRKQVLTLVHRCIKTYTGQGTKAYAENNEILIIIRAIFDTPLAQREDLVDRCSQFMKRDHIDGWSGIYHLLWATREIKPENWQELLDQGRKWFNLDQMGGRSVASVLKAAHRMTPSQFSVAMGGIKALFPLIKPGDLEPEDPKMVEIYRDVASCFLDCISRILSKKDGDSEQKKAIDLTMRLVRTDKIDKSYQGAVLRIMETISPTLISSDPIDQIEDAVTQTMRLIDGKDRDNTWISHAFRAIATTAPDQRQQVVDLVKPLFNRGLTISGVEIGLIITNFSCHAHPNEWQQVADLSSLLIRDDPKDYGDCSDKIFSIFRAVARIKPADQRQQIVDFTRSLTTDITIGNETIASVLHFISSETNPDQWKNAAEWLLIKDGMKHFDMKEQLRAISSIPADYRADMLAILKTHEDRLGYRRALNREFPNPSESDQRSFLQLFFLSQTPLAQLSAWLF